MKQAREGRSSAQRDTSRAWRLGTIGKSCPKCLLQLHLLSLPGNSVGEA